MYTYVYITFVYVCMCGQVKALGVKDINNFAADDLYEAKNMKQVILSILAFGQNCIYIYICISLSIYIYTYIYIYMYVYMVG